MADLILPDRRLEMPALLQRGRKLVTEATIDWSHRLAKDLVFCYAPVFGYRDLVTGMTMTPTGAHKITQNLGSLGSHINAPSGHGIVSDAASALPLTDRVTIHAIVSLDDLTGTAESLIFDHRLPSPSVSLAIYPATKTVRFIMKTDGVTGWTASNDIVIPELAADKACHISGRYKNGSNMQIFFNGAEVKAAVVSGALNGGSGDSDIVVHGKSPIASGTAVAHAGSLFAAYVWKANLRDTDIACIKNDPYQFLMPV